MYSCNKCTCVVMFQGGGSGGSSGLGQFSGNWVMLLPNGQRETYRIGSDGKVVLSSSMMSGQIERSDNQQLFPSSQGWWKLHFGSGWMYMRMNGQGKLEVHRFSQPHNSNCAATYNNLNNYCYMAQGEQQGSSSGKI